MEDYLISNEIGDFIVAFALWGIIFGFANMPKTLTNNLFLSDDLDYISEVYKYIYKQIYEIELDGKAKPQLPPSLPPPSLPTNLKKELSEYMEYTELKSEEVKQEVLDKLSEKGINSLEQLTKKTADEIKWSSQKGQKKLMRAIINKKKSVVENCYQENSLFPIGMEFYKDAVVWDYIQDIIPKNQQKTIKNEIEWIQKVHEDGGYKKKSGEVDEWIELKDHTNKAVIQHFKNNSKNRIESNLLNQIVAKLKELYLPNE